MMTENNSKGVVRQSNFELLRLISMFFIVYYHLLRFFIVEIDDSVIYKALYLPLHVAVICFVLISGYFHIKPTSSGVIKLLLPLVLFYLPLTVWEYFNGQVGAKSLLLFSKSPYWFIRTYFCLFLVAPLLNNYLTDNKKRLQLLFIFAFFAIYLGVLREPSLKGGKNVILFMFLYILGDCIKAYKLIIDRLNINYFLLLYFSFNIFITISYIYFHGKLFGIIIWELSYPYCSPLLIFNALLLFIIFSKIEIRSRVVNWFSSSVLSIYILHHQHFILYSLIGPVVYYIYNNTSNVSIILLEIGLLTFVIMLISILIDKALSPFDYIKTYIKNRDR